MCDFEYEDIIPRKNIKTNRNGSSVIDNYLKLNPDTYRLVGRIEGVDEEEEESESSDESTTTSSEPFSCDLGLHDESPSHLLLLKQKPLSLKPGEMSLSDELNEVERGSYTNSLSISNYEDDDEKYCSLDSGNSTIHEELSHMSSIEFIEETHRGLYKFIPRHHDEIQIEIGDPIYVEKESDDFWCEGINLRSGEEGIFPNAYVVDINYSDFDQNGLSDRKERYLTNYLGSLEIYYNLVSSKLSIIEEGLKKLKKGTQGTSVILEISQDGIRMFHRNTLVSSCSSEESSKESKKLDYFYGIGNITYYGIHPNDQRYFTFVTKHPTLNRFASHLFMSKYSQHPIQLSITRAFEKFYEKFLETTYTVEDFYLE